MKPKHFTATSHYTILYLEYEFLRMHEAKFSTKIKLRKTKKTNSNYKMHKQFDNRWGSIGIQLTSWNAHEQAHIESHRLFDDELGNS